MSRFPSLASFDLIDAEMMLIGVFGGLAAIWIFY
jgi:hypothetical protein